MLLLLMFSFSFFVTMAPWIQSRAGAIGWAGDKSIRTLGTRCGSKFLEESFQVNSIVFEPWKGNCSVGLSSIHIGEEDV